MIVPRITTACRGKLEVVKKVAVIPDTERADVINLFGPQNEVDDFGRETVAAVAIRIRFHRRILAATNSS